jgi:hypothetical protein
MSARLVGLFVVIWTVFAIVMTAVIVVPLVLSQLHVLP